MFFLLSKTLDTALSPFTWALALLLGAVFWRTTRPRRAHRATLAALLILIAFSFEFVPNALWHILESPTTRTVRDDITYDAVLLLGGLVDDRITEDNGAPAYGESVERLLTTYDLLRTGRARFAVISAGPIEANAKTTEAQILTDQLIAWGIAPERVIPERTARNTRENAIEMARIAREHGWTQFVAVTSASHMPRALGCFHVVGLAVDALPVDYRSFDPSRHRLTWLPRVTFLAQSTWALHELAGGVVYRLRGYAR